MVGLVVNKAFAVFPNGFPSAVVERWVKENNLPGVLGSRPVAYFSAEFGLHESVPIYSGGLGVLSGDHIKSASSLAVPLVAVGLFYDQGYFKQHLDESGYQLEEYLQTNIHDLPMVPAFLMNTRNVA